LELILNVYSRTAVLSLTVAALSAPAVAFASEKPESDPCPGEHITVWKGTKDGFAHDNDGRFVCGPLQGEPGKDGEDGEDGKDGENGTNGTNGTNGQDGKSPVVTFETYPVYENGDELEGAWIGSVVVVLVDGVPAGQFEVANGQNGTNGVDGKNGTNGQNGADGKNGAAGKPGVSKTVIVNTDGTTEEVPSLPETGGNGDVYWLLALAGLGLAGGGYALYRYTR
jgi:hypothetical protein